MPQVSGSAGRPAGRHKLNYRNCSGPPCSRVRARGSMFELLRSGQVEVAEWNVRLSVENTRGAYITLNPSKFLSEMKKIVSERKGEISYLLCYPCDASV